MRDGKLRLRNRTGERMALAAVLISFFGRFTDMEHTQDNPASQNPTPAGDTAQPIAENVAEQVTSAAEPSGAPSPEPSAEAALAEAQAKLAELNEGFLRAKAETENVRRRAHEDVLKARKFAIESFAEYLLPVIDSLEAALADSSGDVAKFREGVELTLKQLSSALEKGRVVAVDPVGEKFDPHRHQAISMVPAEQEPNTVVSVLQKGYVIADRVLRPALVTVAQPK
jgi:molecular chaperone GrpE